MITVSGLTKKYGDRTVVDDVSFELEPGTVTGFLVIRKLTSVVLPRATRPP